jgi:hypothetical protein
MPTIAVRAPNREDEEDNCLSVSPVLRVSSPTPLARKGTTITGKSIFSEKP